MREKNALVIGGLVVLLTLLPFGYLFHVNPRFPGSLPGSLIGIVGAALMLVPLVAAVGMAVEGGGWYLIHRAAQNDIASVSIALAADPQARQFHRCRGSDSGQIWGRLWSSRNNFGEKRFCCNNLLGFTG